MNILQRRRLTVPGPLLETNHVTQPSSSFRPAAVITGASDGIGAELARVFAQKGHEIVIVARRKERLDALADEITRAGAKTPTIIVLDLSSPDASDILAQKLSAAGLATKYLVNNACFGLMGRVSDLNANEQLCVIDLNIRALSALTLAFLPDITRQQGGILNVASIAAFMPGPGFAVYYASKAYVRSFSEALGEELKSTGVKVSCLCPGPVATGFQQRAGFDFSGTMGAMKPAMVPALDVALEAYDGLMQGRRIVIPGLINRLLVFFTALTPRAILLPLLAAAQKKR